jgi:hypothetical protein
MFDLRPTGKKTNHKKGISLALKQSKQAEAKIRQDIYNMLTTTQKIAKLDKGGYAAKKQRAKLATIGS